MNDVSQSLSQEELDALADHRAELWALWYAFDADDLARAEARFDAAHTQLEAKRS